MRQNKIIISTRLQNLKENSQRYNTTNEKNKVEWRSIINTERRIRINELIITNAVKRKPLIILKQEEYKQDVYKIISL
jgi:hypothetical protein